MEDKQYIITETMLNKIRGIRNINKKDKSFINEESNGSSNDTDAIAITNSPKFGQNVLRSQEDAFKSAVNSGTVFASENESDPTSNPLVYITKRDDINRPANIVFSGTIPAMSNLKFQFKLNEASGNGCFVWADGLSLTDENIKTLNKLYGYYLNWKDQWNKDIDSLINVFQK